MPPNILPHIRETVLRILSLISTQLYLRGYHPLWPFVPEEFSFPSSELERVLQHHISTAFLQRIRFRLCRVQSPLLTASQLISFPAGTKTFQFPAFPILSDRIGSPIEESPVQHLHATPRSISQLAAPFISVLSRVIPLAAYCLILSAFVAHQP